MKESFLFGAVYIIEQDYTDDEMRRDLLNMKNCGFNLITLWPVANAWLAKSSHEWVFEKTRYVLDLCENLGMKAILQLFGQNQAQEFMPDSASISEMEYYDESEGYINENCFWSNLNHPTVREYFDLYFKEAITALKNHPAVYGWDVFNEAHFRSDDSWTTEKYQQWLKNRYQKIENLNYHWYRRYESFSQIRPEKRRAPYSIWSSLLPSVEYEKFRSVNVTEICQFLYDTARKYDKKHPIFIDGTSSEILWDKVIMRNNDEFDTAKVPDIYGATFYPKSWGRDYKETPWTLSMYFSIPAGAARSAGKSYFVNELQTHTQSVLTPGSEVSCEELVSWTLMCIFTEISGMQLWRWRPFLHGYQSTGRGLTLMDGTPNERANAIQTLLEIVNYNRNVFANAKIVKPQVQFAVSYDVRLWFDSLLKFGESGPSFWSKNVEGWYQYFWDAGILPEFTNLDNLDERCMQIPVMVLPGIIRITENQAKKIVSYVENGGILIADGRLGTLNEVGCVPAEGIPGGTLSKLFGVVEYDVESNQKMLINESHYPIGFQSQKLKLLSPDVEVLVRMEDGLPAVVSHQYGNGKAIYVNNFEGLVLLEESIPELRKILWNAFNPTLVPFAKKDRHVHISRMETMDTYSILIVNFSDNQQDITIYGIPEKTQVKELFSGELLTVSKDFTVQMPACSHAIYIYEKK